MADALRTQAEPDRLPARGPLPELGDLRLLKDLAGGCPAKINPTALWIGFARRFAPYKRADLILSDLDRLDRILNHPTRPVHIVFAGKAHPNDEMGKDLIHKVIEMPARRAFPGEDLLHRGLRHRVAASPRPGRRRLAQQPPPAAGGERHQRHEGGHQRRPQPQRLRRLVGRRVRRHERLDHRPRRQGLAEDDPADEDDGQSLYALLEETVIPLFYDREMSGLPEKWIAMIKRSMETLVPRFNTERMLLEYYANMYIPAARREHDLARDGYRMAREVADWKRKIPMRFSSLRLLDVSVEGIRGDCVFVGNPFVVSVKVDPGKLDPEEVMAELVIGRRDGCEFIGEPDCVPLTMMGKDAAGILTFTGVYIVKENGPHLYGVRVLPYNRSLASKQEVGLVLWG